MDSMKFDGDKPQVVKGFFRYFPRAIVAVTRISEFGSIKYDWNNWQELEGGEDRMTEAMGRHLLAEGIDPFDCGEGGSELLHAAHTAWCAMARLEKMCQSEEEEGEVLEEGEIVPVHPQAPLIQYQDNWKEYSKSEGWR